MKQTLEYLSHGKFQYCNICFCQESVWKFSITVALFAYGKKTLKVFLVEMLLSVSLWMLQLWEWHPHPHHTSCALGNYSPPGSKAPKIHHIHFALSPLTTEVFPPCMWPLLSAPAGVKGRSGSTGRRCGCLWEGTTRGRGGGGEWGLEAAHPSPVPRRGRALWLPTAWAFIFILLTRDTKKMNLREAPFLTLQMCFVWGIQPALLSEYQAFARCI